MGYEAPSTAYLLAFGEGTHDGLEIRVRSTSLGTLLEMIDLDQRRRSGEPGAALLRQIEILGEYLVSWNLTRDNEPVPSDLEGLKDQEPLFVGQILRAWIDSMSSVPAPLEDDSADGLRSLEESMETVPL